MFKDKKDNIFILGRFLSFKLFYLMFRLDHDSFQNEYFIRVTVLLITKKDKANE